MRDNRFVKPINEFVTAHYFQTLVVLFAAIVFTFFATKDYIPMIARFGVPWVLLALIFAQTQHLRAILLFWVVIGLGLNLGVNFYVTANHGFMIAYIGIALMISCAKIDEPEIVMQRSAVFLISILMGLALIQKLISPYYMSGQLIGSYLATGQMFKVILSLFIPGWADTVASNAAAQMELARNPTLAHKEIVVPAIVGGMAILLTYAALISQAALEIMVLARRRLGIWTHYGVLLFVLIIYSTRNENVFLSMNLILGYAMTDENTKPARLWYVVGIIYLLSMELMGLRPGIIG